LSTLVSRYATLAAISGHPLENSITDALLNTEYAGGEGTSARAKKYSMLSSNPVKFSSGETRPVALAAKRPLGTAEEPSVMMGRLSANAAFSHGLALRGTVAR